MIVTRIEKISRGGQDVHAEKYSDEAGREDNANIMQEEERKGKGGGKSKDCHWTGGRDKEVSLLSTKGVL